MITIDQFLKTIEYKISESNEYLWECYGPNARSIDYNSATDVEHSVSISAIFDTVTQTVYEMQTWDGKNNREYRWIHPEYIDAIKKESKRRGVEFQTSVDNNRFIEIEVDDDILEKTRAIFLNEEYDSRILVKLTLSDNELFRLMTMAHEADMTLNKYVENFLLEEIKKRS